MKKFVTLLLASFTWSGAWGVMPGGLKGPEHRSTKRAVEERDGPWEKFKGAFSALGGSSSVKTRARGRTVEDEPPKTKEEELQIPGGPRQRAFISYVLSYAGKVQYHYGREESDLMDCSYFVQYALEKRGMCGKKALSLNPNFDSRLDTSDSMSTLFGPSKKCEPADIVVTSGHMGFYWGPGEFVGNNSGQNGVGVHGSHGRCYPNPCL